MQKQQLVVHLAIILGGLAMIALGLFGHPVTSSLGTARSQPLAPKRQATMPHRVAYITFGCVLAAYGVLEIMR